MSAGRMPVPDESEVNHANDLMNIPLENKVLPLIHTRYTVISGLKYVVSASQTYTSLSLHCSASSMQSYEVNTFIQVDRKGMIYSYLENCSNPPQGADL